MVKRKERPKDTFRRDSSQIRKEKVNLTRTSEIIARLSELKTEL